MQGDAGVVTSEMVKKVEVLEAGGNTESIAFIIPVQPQPILIPPHLSVLQKLRSSDSVPSRINAENNTRTLLTTETEFIPVASWFKT